MDPALFNVFWWLSVAAPFLVMVPAAVAARSTTPKLIWIAAPLSVVLTWWLSTSSMERRWQIYAERARTDAEFQAASSDGAKIAFWSLTGAPVQAVLLTVAGAYLGRRIVRRTRSGVV